MFNTLKMTFMSSIIILLLLGIFLTACLQLRKEDIMQLYSYKVLDSVIRQKSFSKAAGLLNLTPSAVSHIIARLEDELGMKLLIRDRRGLRLTSSAEELFPDIQDLLYADEQLEQHVAAMHGLERGTIRIGTFNSVTVMWLPHILRSFRSEYPEIDIQVYQGGYDSIINWLNNNIVDLAFLSESSIIGLRCDKVHWLYKDRMCCVTPPDYTPEHDDVMHIEEIRDLPLVMQVRGYDQEAQAIINKYDLSAKSMYHMGEDNSVIALVSAGFGIYLMPELVIDTCTGNFNSYPIDPPEYRRICLVESNPQYSLPAVEKMRDHIIAFAESYGR